MLLADIMNRLSGKKGVSYLHLGLQSIFFLWTAKFATGTVHELFHGLGGLAGGLKFYGFYISAFSGGQAFVSMDSRATWQSVLSSMAGPFADLVLGCFILFVLWPRAKKCATRLFWLFAATTTLLIFWAYMFMDGWGLTRGDFANMSIYLGLSRLVAGIVGLLGLATFAYLLSRAIFATLAPYFVFASYGRRFLVLFLFLGLPNVIYFVMAKLLEPEQTLIQAGLLSLQAIVWPAFLALFPPKQGLGAEPLPRKPSRSAALCFSGVCVLWLGVFGLTPRQARGLLWTLPEENHIPSCNILISLGQDAAARIEFAMRPFSPSGYGGALFWRKLRNRAPDWTPYEKFVRKNLPTLIGVSGFEVVEKVNDPGFPFCSPDGQSPGARRIVVVANVGEQLRKSHGNISILEVTDFWRASQGFIDSLRVVLDEGLKFEGYQLVPGDAQKPDTFGAREIVWRNKSSQAPEKIRLLISPS